MLPPSPRKPEKLVTAAFSYYSSQGLQRPRVDWRSFSVIPYHLSQDGAWHGKALKGIDWSWPNLGSSFAVY